MTIIILKKKPFEKKLKGVFFFNKDQKNYLKSDEW